MDENVFQNWWKVFKRVYPGWNTQYDRETLVRMVFEAGFEQGENSHRSRSVLRRIFNLRS